MLEINNLEITKETFEDLNVSLKKSIMEIREGNTDGVLYRLQALQKNIENNLMMDKEERK